MTIVPRGQGACIHPKFLYNTHEAGWTQPNNYLPHMVRVGTHTHSSIYAYSSAPTRHTALPHRQSSSLLLFTAACQSSTRMTSMSLSTPPPALWRLALGSVPGMPVAPSPASSSCARFLEAYRVAQYIHKSQVSGWVYLHELSTALPLELARDMSTHPARPGSMLQHCSLGIRLVHVHKLSPFKCPVP